MMDEETVRELREVVKEVIREANARHANNGRMMESFGDAARRIRRQIDRGEVEE